MNVPDGFRPRRGRSADTSLRRARSRRIATAVVTLAVLAGLGATVLTLQVVRAVAGSAFEAEYSDFLSAQAEATTLIDSARASIDAARTTLNDSAGKVLSEDTRTALSDVIETASAQVDDADSLLMTTGAQAEEVANTTASLLDNGGALRAETVTLASYTFANETTITAIPAQLADSVQAVNDAVALWQAEQDRILRERYTNHVQAVGWIAELDQCKGSVDLSAHYGTAAIAEHWSCGGKDFPDEPGTIITLTGVRAGTYRVDGIVLMLNQHRATVADIPLGYDLLYQTCQNGQSTTMSLTALTKMG